MHLDYRCFIKLDDPLVLRDCLKKIELEASDGNVYSVSEIADIFTDFEQWNKITDEPIGDIFDTVTLGEKEGFCYIHDRQKSFSFFKDLTAYIFEVLNDNIPNKFIIVADVTDYDDDSFGNHIFYYLGGDKAIKTVAIDGPDGLESHDENEISEFVRILKDYEISENEKQNADKYYIKLENLIDGYFDEEEIED